MEPVTGHEYMGGNPKPKKSKITTGYGDDGWTYAGIHNHCAKDGFVIDALGDLDELNCWIGRIRENFPQYDEPLSQIQRHIFEFGVFVTQYIPPIGLEEVRWLENMSVELEADLPDLKNFILPHYPSEVHIARAICRRCERKVCFFMRKAEAWKHSNVAVPYLNRLSDYLFILARKICHDAGKPEDIWSGTKIGGKWE